MAVDFQRSRLLVRAPYTAHMAQRTRKRAVWKVAVVALLAVIAIALSVLALVRNSGGDSPAPQIYAVGDSITEADSPNFVGGQYGAGSWVSHLDPRIRVVGGWARGGATTDDMVRNVTAAPNANTLVMLAGSNDLANRVPFDTTRANLERIAETVGTDRVVLSAIPPRDADPAGAVRFNEQLKALAQERGWEFIDPTAGIRDNNRYAPGMSNDGIHPTPRAAEILGRDLGAEILAR